MSKFIKHISGLERRIGKQVKVNSTDYYGVKRDSRGVLKVGPFEFTSQVVLDAFLKDHTIAAAGYTRDCGCSKGFTETMADIPVDTQLEVLFKDFKDYGWITGEFRWVRENGSAHERLFFLSDCPSLDGCIAVDKRGYRSSWVVANEHSRSISYPVKFRQVLRDGKEGLWSLVKDDGEVVKTNGKLKYDKDDKAWLLCTNSDKLNGLKTIDKFKDGYKNSWWIYDGKECKSGSYNLRYLGTVKPEEETVKKPYITDRECMVTLKPEAGHWEDEVHTVVGKLVFADGWYLLTNEARLDGGQPGDRSVMKGYSYSWYICHAKGELEDDPVLIKTEELEEKAAYIVDEPCLLQTNTKPEVVGVYAQEKDGYYILTNDKRYNGATAPDMRGYQYSWWVGCTKDSADCLGLITKPLPDVAKEPAEDPLVRIAMALEDIATYLSRMSK